MDTPALILGLSVLGVASYSDLRTREVPDTLSYLFLAVAVAYGCAKALLASSWLPLFAMLAGLVALGSLGLVMYYLGQWGGADTKLAAGVGALLGLWAPGFEALVFLVVLLFAGALYGVVYTLYLAIRNRDRFAPAFREQLVSRPIIMVRRVVLGCLLLMCVALLYLASRGGGRTLLVFLGVIVACYVLFYLWLVVRVVERAVLVRPYALSELREGDWIVDDVLVAGERICGPKDLGISNEQIAQLKKRKVKSVVVREGIPFIPPFLIAYAFVPSVGPWLLALLPF